MNKVNRNGQFNLASRQPIDRSYQRNEQKIDNSRDSHIYFNITLVNNSPTPIQAQYAEVRSDPLLINPEDYHMSIERFTVPTLLTIPLDSYDYGTGGSTYPTVVSCTIAYTGTYVQAFWGTGSLSPPDYTGPVGGNGPLGLLGNDKALNINYYQSVCDIMNSTIAQAETTIKANCPTYTGDFTPFMSYDSNTNLFSINTPRTYSVDNPGAPQLWFNKNAYIYLNSVPAIANNISQSNPTGCDYRIKCRNYGGINGGHVNGITVLSIPYSITGSTCTGYSNPQEYPGLGNITIFDTIQFLTNDIPVTPQGINNQTINAISDTSRLVFTNYKVISDVGYDIRNFVSFYLQGERRLIDLQGNDPLRKISWNIYWSDPNQNLYPVYIQQNYPVDVLVLFVKKGQYH
jgi:hypothetical protein